MRSNHFSSLVNIVLKRTVRLLDSNSLLKASTQPRLSRNLRCSGQTGLLLLRAELRVRGSELRKEPEILLESVGDRMLISRPHAEPIRARVAFPQHPLLPQDSITCFFASRQTQPGRTQQVSQLTDKYDSSTMQAWMLNTALMLKPPSSRRRSVRRQDLAYCTASSTVRHEQAQNFPSWLRSVRRQRAYISSDLQKRT
jgi:hypothetical protein